MLVEVWTASVCLGPVTVWFRCGLSKIFSRLIVSIGMLSPVHQGNLLNCGLAGMKMIGVDYCVAPLEVPTLEEGPHRHWGESKWRMLLASWMHQNGDRKISRRVVRLYWDMYFILGYTWPSYGTLLYPCMFTSTSISITLTSTSTPSCRKEVLYPIEAGSMGVGACDRSPSPSILW